MKRLFEGTPGVRHMIVLGLMAAGFNTVELITNNLIPITCRHFTDSAFIISAILATNRLFGFVVQPYVCWKSDYVRTRFGRRRPFLLTGLPLTAVSLVLVGLLPVFIQGEARHTLAALALVVAINVLLQAVVDINWGTLEPLYADTFQQRQLGRASSVRQIFGQVSNLLMVGLVIGWADANELYPYLFSAGCVMLSLALVIFVVRERPAGEAPPATTYNPIQHIGLLFRHRDYAKLAFICAANLVLPAALFLFTPLYVTDTLGLSKGDLGRMQMAGPILTIVLGLPIGWLVDYLGPKWVMTAGFVCHAVAFAGMALWAHDFWSLFACMTVFGVAQVVALLPMTAMVFQYADASERGQVFGVIQFTRAFSAFVLSLVMGSVVQFADSYEPTPLRDQDLKDLTKLTRRLAAPEDEVGRYVRERLAPETRERIAPAAAAVTPELRARLLADFNRIVFGPPIHSESRFAGVTLSRQSRELLSRPKVEGDDLAVLNRSLLADAFPGQISRKVDYRLPYFIGIALAILAAMVALSTRRGRFAQTLGDREPATS